MKVLAIIPARGGSKGIPNKNIIEVLGKPLIAYTIEQALQSKYISKVVVSTDSQKIADVSKELGAEVPILRPAYLAEDHAKTIDSIVHMVDYYKAIGEEYDYVVVLQPTQPLRKSWHIDEAIEKISKSSQDSLVSVCQVKEHPILMRTIDTEGNLNALLNENSTVRRQDFKMYYKVNGCIYINKLNQNFDATVSLNDNKLAYIMEEKYSLDIDEPFDLEILKLMLEYEASNEL